MSNATYENLTTLTPNPSANLNPPNNLSGSDPTSASYLPSSEPTELAHYRIVRLLGQGGMGKVYEAEDMKLHRVVALKVMLPEVTDAPVVRERFLREARSMAAVRNDHVVTIYEVSQADDVPYLAMEFLQGETLEGVLKGGTSLPVGDIVRIGREIAAGLAAAQTRGLIHRDIKPANLWLEVPTGRIKILDFGLARPAQSNSGLTEKGDIVGTPSYMSPEQARGAEVDGRGDLFSLGIVLYRLCTRQLPFQGKTITAVLTALAVDPPAPIHDLNPTIPTPLADLVMQLLEKDPNKRPQSAALVVDALCAIAERLPAAPSRLLPRESGCDAATTPTLGHGAFSNTLAESPPASPTSPKRSRRSLWKPAAAIVAGLIVALGLSWWGFNPADKNTDPTGTALAPTGAPLRLGVLYSRTGTMSISERAVRDGVALAVSEINDGGGVLGRPLETVIEDGQSNEAVFARKAAKLIEKDNVSALFGTWTSASRKAVKAVVEEHDQLLFYPVSYEGMELSPNIVCGGSVPNQQILPALRWSVGFLNKRRWFLVGLDSIYSHAAHAVIRDEAKELGLQIAGEQFLLEDQPEIADLVRRIEEAKPDLIINTIKGDTNVAFFRALCRAGIRPAQVPILSFTISEEELRSLSPDEVQGHYAAGNYFQSLDLPRNVQFLQRVRGRFDAERIVSDPMQTTYTLVHLLVQAVKEAGSADVTAVRLAIKGRQFDAPQGRVVIDPATLHTVQTSRVGKIDEKGRFSEVYASPQPVTPEPFPASRDRAAWEQFVQGLHQRWRGRWHNSGR